MPEVSGSDAKGRTHDRERRWDRDSVGKGNKWKDRRSDKPLYIPHTLRHKEDLEQLNLNQSSKDSSSSNAEESLVANQRPAVDTTDQSNTDKEFVQLSRSGPSPWPPEWDKTVTFFMSMALEEQADENRAKNMEESLLVEIKANLQCEDVTVLNTWKDFPAFAEIWLDPERFGHVIEIYDFPPIFTSNNFFFSTFADYSKDGMKIRWVDSRHVLGVFSSQSAATQALTITHPILKTRPLLEGSQNAKLQAIAQAEFIQPVKKRPNVDMAVAQRMVTRVLGLKQQAGGTTPN